MLPSAESAQLRIFNTLDCPVKVSLTFPESRTETTINSLSMYADLNVKAKENVTILYSADFLKCINYSATKEKVEGKFTLEMKIYASVLRINPFRQHHRGEGHRVLLGDNSKWIEPLFQRFGRQTAHR